MVTLPPGEPARLRAIATAVRGPAAPPAIFVHGVLPRSGTNFLVDALALHPHVHAIPGACGNSRYCTSRPAPRPCSGNSCPCSAANAEVMGRFDLLAYLASGWLAALQKEAGQRRLLLKSPHVQNLALFRHIFPSTYCSCVCATGATSSNRACNTFARWHATQQGICRAGP